MNTSHLSGIGLTKLEIKVYLAVLEIGSATAGPISQKSGVHRRSVYDALDRLLEKGLVSTMKVNNRTEFQAVDPKRLLGLVKEKENDINSILPQLMLKFNSTREKQETLFFKGKEGIKSIFDDQLNVGETIQIISGSTSAYEMLPYYIKRYDKERKRKKIQAQILFNNDYNDNNNNNNNKIKNTKKKERIQEKIKKPPLSQIKYLPEGYGGMSSINIYGDNVGIILWNKENPFGILIRQKEIADSYRNYFQLLWKIGKK